MKKLFMALALVLFTATSILAQSQETKEVTLRSKYNGTVTDTIGNAGVRVIANVEPLGLIYDVVVIQATVTKISGTVGGIARLKASQDGSNWFRIAKTDSVFLANVSTAQAVGFQVQNSGYKYIAIEYTGAATQSAKMTATLTARRKK